MSLMKMPFLKKKQFLFLFDIKINLMRINLDFRLMFDLV
jgi:hypothetical protein